MIGLTIPFLSTGDIWNNIINIFVFHAPHIGAIFYAFPVLWIAGFGIDLWKG
ncbi:MAG: hypothetical protein ACREBS_10475 [Nitrososphaerales archaeon]